MAMTRLNDEPDTKRNARNMVRRVVNRNAIVAKCHDGAFRKFTASDQDMRDLMREVAPNDPRWLGSNNYMSGSVVLREKQTLGFYHEPSQSFSPL